MSNDILMYLLIGVGALFVIIIGIYFLLRKKMGSAEAKRIKQLRQGTQVSKFSGEILYQKLYVIYLKTPFLKRYLLKLRRKLEIINVDDEYLTRKQASKILTNTLLVISENNCVNSYP